MFLQDMFDFVRDKGLKWRVTAELIVGGFFFAMRACEFCQTETPGRTQSLILQDIEFRDDNDQIVEHTQTDLEELSGLVTVRFRNQKNGTKGEKRTLKRSGHESVCPVKAWARIVRRIRSDLGESANDFTRVSVFRDGLEIKEISAKNVIELLRWSCEENGGKQRYGLCSSEIGTRSIRSGAAMSLALQEGASDRKIMMLGRWKSEAFLHYIRPQVLEMAGDTARVMSQTTSIKDVGEYDRPTQPTNITSQNRAPHRQ